jgi:repressor LexA
VLHVALTKKQKDILDYVQAHIHAHGYAPTLREIGTHFGLSSVATVHKHLRILADKGLLSREVGRARALEVVEDTHRAATEVPLLGLIAAGAPIEALPNPEGIALPESLLGRGETYVLQVKGNSMIEDHIMDGDFIIVERRDHAGQGEITVALIDNEATVKRFYHEPDGRIRLQPANAALRPLYYSEDAVRVQGIVIGVLRKMKR